ncbi:hypothetical protein EXM65_12640 [Clostridium botulinum]|uniref:Uncharacterized protein n=1 Tax=Clostridium botulinum TaxID=1491 RepID=A0A6M0SSQ8_CLOBO|nr:hypothetical protein [Clostridium botulinum]NFO35115.1 hypothetical protein [Clostridium botulinum]NFO48356.1 hypothetical protein [Clostridium botulinum]
MIKYMVTATFQEENIINECEGNTRLLIGENQIFYCGDNNHDAVSIFDTLPNDDKSIFKANVNFIKIKNRHIVKDWKIIENLELL